MWWAWGGGAWAAGARGETDARAAAASVKTRGPNGGYNMLTPLLEAGSLGAAAFLHDGAPGPGWKEGVGMDWGAGFRAGVRKQVLEALR